MSAKAARLSAISVPTKLALGSSVLAAIALAVALRVTHADDALAPHARDEHGTPERAAEAFVDAYCDGNLERAADYAGEQLRKTLLRKSARGRLPHLPRRTLVIEESHTLTKSRTRLVTVVAKDDEPDDPGLPLELIMERTERGFVVDELSWPNGEPERAP